MARNSEAAPQGKEASIFLYLHSAAHGPMGTAIPNNFLARFNVIKKCTYKFHCIVNEMLCIQDPKPALNVQSDSLSAKVFM